MCYVTVYFVAEIVWSLKKSSALTPNLNDAFSQ